MIAIDNLNVEIRQLNTRLKSVPEPEEEIDQETLHHDNKMLEDIDSGSIGIIGIEQEGTEVDQEFIEAVTIDNKMFEPIQHDPESGIVGTGYGDTEGDALYDAALDKSGEDNDTSQGEKAYTESQANARVEIKFKCGNDKGYQVLRHGEVICEWSPDGGHVDHK